MNEHIEQAADYFLAIGQNMLLGDDPFTLLRKGAIFHDIEMMVLPDCIMQKPWPGTEEE